jgi:seryl-tRNA synthetase
VAKQKVAKEDATEAMAAAKALDMSRKAAEEEEKSLEEEVNKKLCKIGNLVHESVPVSDDEANNVVYRAWGLDTKRMEDKLPNHVDLVVGHHRW